jgi:hypothetical protein
VNLADLVQFGKPIGTLERAPMRAAIIGITSGALLASTGIVFAATRLAPNEIQATFFNGQAFTSSTPSNIKFKMVFMPDGKVTREPLGKSGIKGDGTWKLSKDGFCTTWKGSKANCFTVVSSGQNKWSVMKGTAPIAYWNK